MRSMSTLHSGEWGFKEGNSGSSFTTATCASSMKPFVIDNMSNLFVNQTNHLLLPTFKEYFYITSVCTCFTQIISDNLLVSVARFFICPL